MNNLNLSMITVSDPVNQALNWFNITETNSYYIVKKGGFNGLP